MFKLGQTTKAFHKRIEAYHGYVGPSGVRIVGFLSSPTRGRPKGQTLTTYYQHVEEYAFQAAQNAGAEFIWSTTRVLLSGRTEFVYGSFHQMEQALQNTQDVYGGTLQMFHLNNVNNELAAEKRAFPNSFIGETLFPISTKNQHSVKRSRAGGFD